MFYDLIFGFVEAPVPFLGRNLISPLCFPWKIFSNLKSLLVRVVALTAKQLRWHLTDVSHEETSTMVL